MAKTGLPFSNATLCMSSTELLGLSSTMKATSTPGFAAISRIRRLSASFSWNRPSATMRHSCCSFSPPPRSRSRAASSVASRYSKSSAIGASASVLSRANENAETNAGPPWSVNGAPSGWKKRAVRGGDGPDAAFGPSRARASLGSSSSAALAFVASGSAPPKPTTPISPTSSLAIARASMTMLSSARWPHAFSAMLLLSSMASTTWYFRALGLDRRSQILSLRNSLATYGMILRMFSRLPVRKSP